MPPLQIFKNTIKVLLSKVASSSGRTFQFSHFITEKGEEKRRRVKKKKRHKASKKTNKLIVSQKGPP